jgi:molybdopterin-guanine dinucleotide biosynthesis protein B
MKAFSFIGNSGSGKTRLIVRLIPELRKRGWKVAVIKHCPHGFSLDWEGKDSSLFFKAGASGVALVSSRETALVQRNGNVADFRGLAARYFQGVDILLIEGGRAKKGIDKIEVLGTRQHLRPIKKVDERIAVVSDQGGPFGRPVFGHSQIGEIARFLETQPGRSEPEGI